LDPLVPIHCSGGRLPSDEQEVHARVLAGADVDYPRSLKETLSDVRVDFQGLASWRRGSARFPCRTCTRGQPVPTTRVVDASVPDQRREARKDRGMDAGRADDMTPSPFVRFSREEWGRLQASAPLSLSEDDVRDLRRVAGHLSSEEATGVYLPLSWLLHLHVGAAQGLYRSAQAFLGKQAAEVPYVVGIAGSVAAGKSTVAEMVKALISLWPEKPKVELVSTDGFLYPNQVLRSRGLMDRKGFPESYDLPLLLRFLADLKAGRAELGAPIHSHLTYDILPDQAQRIRRPDVLIVEGLNMLEAGLPEPSEGHRVFVSDYVDFSIYVDAEERYIKAWYLDRFLRLREEALGDDSAYFHRFADLSIDEAKDSALRVWDEIDHPNLKENIEPTRDRARLILEKGPDHSVRSVRLRRL